MTPRPWQPTLVTPATTAAVAVGAGAAEAAAKTHSPPLFLLYFILHLTTYFYLNVYI